MISPIASIKVRKRKRYRRTREPEQSNKEAFRTSTGQLEGQEMHMSVVAQLYLYRKVTGRMDWANCTIHDAIVVQPGPSLEPFPINTSVTALVHRSTIKTSPLIGQRVCGTYCR